MTKLKITMVENAFHSLEIGLKSYDDYKKENDKWKLKDCILYLHHAIELLMKQMLLENNILFIFDNFNRGVKAKIKLNTNNDVDIFSKNPKINTVTFNRAIERIEAIFNPKEFKSPINLNKNFQKLNTLRNKIEHSSIEIEEKYVIKIIDSLYEPAKEFFEKYLDIKVDLKISKKSKEIISEINRFMNFKRLSYNIFLLSIWFIFIYGVYMSNVHALIGLIFIIIVTFLLLIFKLFISVFPFIILLLLFLYYIIYLIVIASFPMSLLDILYSLLPIVYTISFSLNYRRRLL